MREAGVHLALGPSHLWSRQPVSPNYTCTISAGCCVLMSHFLASSVLPCGITLNLGHLMKCPFLNSPLLSLLFQGSVPRKEASGENSVHLSSIQIGLEDSLLYRFPLLSNWLKGCHLGVVAFKPEQGLISQSTSSCTNTPM